jgi:hypothetical protein
MGMKTLFLLVLVIMFMGCDPGYSVYIYNQSSSPLYFKTHPSIESFYDSAHLSYYDSLLAHRVKKDSLYSMYKIEPNSRFLVWSHIGVMPSINELPIDYIKIMNDRDTLILDSKEKIISQIKKTDKKFNYSIEVVK